MPTGHVNDTTSRLAEVTCTSLVLSRVYFGAAHDLLV